MSERTTPLVKNAGVDVGRGRTIDFIAGANIDLTITETPSEEINVTIGSSGGAGAGVDVEEDNAAVGTATILDFGTGFDVGFAAGEADVSLDLSEVAAGGELGGFLNAPTVDTTHSGSSHAGSVTFENLDANGDVGTGAAQVAQGSHTHAGGSVSFLDVTKWGVD